MSADLREIFNQHGYAYQTDSRTSMSYQQIRVMSAISRCRTGELGKVRYTCPGCKHRHHAHRSCGNRHCPRCQGQKTIKWIETQAKKRLPVEYFLMTFTLPAELRPLLRHLREDAYDEMFHCSSSVIRDMLEKRYGIKTCGFTSILHTSGSVMQFHPHIHVLLCGGGLDEHGAWKSLPNGFALPVRAASQLWQGRILAALEQLVGRESLPPNITKHNYVVHCQSAGNGLHTLRYLGRYVFRTAIHDSRIKSVDDKEVTFEYRPREDGEKQPGRNRPRKLKLDHHEFIRRFMMHVLKPGYMRVRHSGFMHPNSKIDLNQLRIQILEFSQQLLTLIPDTPNVIYKPKPILCPCCGQTMRRDLSADEEQSPRFSSA